MATIHIPEAEAASNFAAVMAHVRAGAEVVIEKDTLPIAVVRPAAEQPGRLLSEMIASAEARGSTATIDEEFARDLAAVIEAHREPMDVPAWD
jgi:antitoxin (DNA-binding transcriptional repressor) of toxin-antitoxin stability system